MPLSPIALTCGEPSGVGPELAVRDELPFFWIGDPRHLPQGTAIQLIDSPDQALSVPAALLPVLHHPFASPAPLGLPAPDCTRRR
jgi:4-hydroxythreonine-4-phosphate dehydrogenase